MPFQILNICPTKIINLRFIQKRWWGCVHYMWGKKQKTCNKDIWIVLKQKQQKSFFFTLLYFGIKRSLNRNQKRGNKCTKWDHNWNVKAFPKCSFMLVNYLTLNPPTLVLIYEFTHGILMQSLRTHNSLRSKCTTEDLNTAQQLPQAFCFLSNKYSLEFLFLNIWNVVGSPGGKWVSQSPFSWWFHFTMAVNVINAPVSREWSCQLQGVQMCL